MVLGKEVKLPAVQRFSKLSLKSAKMGLQLLNKELERRPSKIKRANTRAQSWKGRIVVGAPLLLMFCKWEVAEGSREEVEHSRGRGHQGQ